jgi:hypothetical protein
MLIGNYFEVKKKFWNNRQTLHSINSSDAALYDYLLYKSVELQKNAFNDTNYFICMATKLSKDTLIDSRNRLKQAGLIDFKTHGVKGKPCDYFILGLDFSTPIPTLSSTLSSTPSPPQLKERKKEGIKLNSEIPNFDFFENYFIELLQALSIEYDAWYKIQVRNKYEEWDGNGWCTTKKNTPIKNWKSLLSNCVHREFIYNRKKAEVFLMMKDEKEKIKEEVKTPLQANTAVLRHDEMTGYDYCDTIMQTSYGERLCTIMKEVFKREFTLDQIRHAVKNFRDSGKPSAGYKDYLAFINHVVSWYKLNLKK